MAIGPGWPLRQAGSCLPRPTARRTPGHRRTRWTRRKQATTPERTSPASGSRHPSQNRTSLPSPGTREWTPPGRARNLPNRPAKSPASPPSARPRPAPRPRRPRCPRHATAASRPLLAPAPPGAPSSTPSRWSARPGLCGAGPAARASRRGVQARGQERRPPGCPRGRRRSACGASRRSRGTSTPRTVLTSRSRPRRNARSPARGRRPRTGTRISHCGNHGHRSKRGHRSKHGHRSKDGRSKDGRSKDGRSKHVSRSRDGRSRDGRRSRLGRRLFRRRGRRIGHRSRTPRAVTPGRATRSMTPGQATCGSRSARRCSPAPGPSRTPDRGPA